MEMKVALNAYGGDIGVSRELKHGMRPYSDMTHAPADKPTYKHKAPASKVADPKAALLFLADEHRIIADTNESLGEVSELDPGVSGTLTLDRTPGAFVPSRKIPGHFEVGIRTMLPVRRGRGSARRHLASQRLKQKAASGSAELRLSLPIPAEAAARENNP
jgi:hypothetical protein